MAGKPRLNHRAVLEAQARLGPEGRLTTMFRSAAQARDQLRQQLRALYPGASEDELRSLYLKRVARWQNRNY